MATDPVLSPTSPHTLTCSDCIAPTPAIEVHMLIAGDAVAYCRSCARTFRPFARKIYPAQVAHQLGIVVTL